MYNENLLANCVRGNSFIKFNSRLMIIRWGGRRNQPESCQFEKERLFGYGYYLSFSVVVLVILSTSYREYTTDRGEKRRRRGYTSSLIYPNKWYDALLQRWLGYTCARCIDGNFDNAKLHSRIEIFSNLVRPSPLPRYGGGTKKGTYLHK